MGLYRKGRTWHLWLERPGQKALRENTYIPHTGVTPSETKRLRDAATEVYHARMAALARARYDVPTGPPPTTTVREWLQWYDEHEARTHRGYAVREQYILRALKDRLGNYSLRQIDSQVLAEWRTERLAEVSPRTWNRERDVLIAALRAAVPKYLDAPPTIPRERVTDPECRVLTVQEEKKLGAVLAVDDYALFIVCMDTLMRLGDALNLRWADVRGAMIRVANAKTGKPQLVPLSARAQAALAALDHDHEYLFPRRRRPAEAWDRSGGVRHAFEEACRKAGVPYGRKVGGVTWHSATRHTGATRMVAGGVDLRTVQSLGAWSDIRLLQRYAHADDDRRARAVELVGSLVATAELAETPEHS